MISGVTVALGQPYALNLYTPAAGDAEYSWNSRYGGDDYSGVGSLSLGASTFFYSGYPSDTQYTVGIFMIPISALAGGELSAATLHVRSAGFDTYYHYGSASLGWLNTGTTALTGNVVADGLGPLAKSPPTGMTVYNSDFPASSTDGTLLSFDVRSYIQADLDAGRAFSTFVLTSSRDTYGSLYSAESGNGPMVVALSSIPEPGTYAAILGIFALAAAFRRARSSR